MKKIIVAIDGLSACGKSSTAKALAHNLHYIYIDSGAMYRAVTLFFTENNTDIKSNSEVTAALEQLDITFRYNTVKQANEIYLNGNMVEEKIRGLDIASKVSEVSAIKAVRNKMVKLQQHIAKSAGKGVVMDGRDIGTVVFPDAEVKIFMTASDEVRAERRVKELSQKGQVADFASVLENLKHRDQMDSNRKESPLRKANDAITVDTSNLQFDEQVSMILKHIKKKTLQNPNS
ncbi:MAG: (d)CMP kinase [Cyclobacteriaceae bacterium]